MMRIWRDAVSRIIIVALYSAAYFREIKGGSGDEYTIRQPGCKIPAVSINGPKVSPYLEKQPPVVCNASHTVAERWRGKVFQTRSHPDYDTLIADDSFWKRHKKNDIECTYQSFHPPTVNSSNIEWNNAEPEYGRYTKKLNLSGENVFVSESDEFIKVECTRKGKKMYEDYFTFVPAKSEVEARCNRLGRKYEYGEKWVNVAMVGLDSVSRQNFQRQLPRSYSYLTEEMSAVEMLGYNKVGDNTIPNLVPAFLNLSLEEAKIKCAPKKGSSFDDCPFVWNQYRDVGYRTAFVDDSSSKNYDVFNELKKGFVGPPADYYPRHWFLEAESKIGHNEESNYRRCFGSRLTLSVLLDYVYDFFRKFHLKKFFGFFWSTTMTHDYFNLPKQVDETFYAFLRSLRDNRLLNRTVLIVLSDHGLRFGSYRSTFQGQLEERLPLLAFVFPPWFRKLYPRAVKNIRENGRRLTTHFDLHNTMIDLMNLASLEDEKLKRRKIRNGARGQSLFLPVSPARKCRDAGIPPHFCTCDWLRAPNRPETNLSAQTRVAAGNAVLRHLNDLLENHPHCAKLNLKKVYEKTFSYSSAVNEATYVILLEAYPGDGLFEATVTRPILSGTTKFLVRQPISRVNEYKDQSYCEKNAALKVYCFCKKQRRRV